MLVACWSAKGGSGTTVVAAALALHYARAGEVLLVDLAGDVPGVLGLPEPDGPGLTGWLAASDDVPADALSRLEVPARPGLAVLPRGPGPLEATNRLEVLAAVLGSGSRLVVADCGVVPRSHDGAAPVARAATHSLLVTRACYLALKRAVALPIRPSGIVLVTEPGRALQRSDVEEVVGAPVRAEVALDPAVARAVDAGLLASRVRVVSSEPCVVPRDPGVEALVGRVHRIVVEATGEPDRTHVETLVHAEAPLLGTSDTVRVVDGVLARVAGLGPLEPLLADPTVSEVMVNPSGRVWVERHGRLAVTDTEIPTGTVTQLAERVVAPLGLRIDRSSPLVDARLADGSRVNIVVPPLAVDGPCLTIRRFVAHDVDLDQVSPPGVAALLRWAVRARANLVVCGGAGAGKTTLLNALAAYIPSGERVVTIEDTAELQLPGDHVVRLEARPANAEGLGEVTLRRLLRNALRMRPDRIIVGEVRGPEAVEMVHAMTTGHEGSLSTCHANGPADALRRLETMALMADVALPLAAVREQLVAAVDLIVHVTRRRGGERLITAVDEVVSAPSSDGARTRALVADGGLVALPVRGRRAPEAPPCSPEWLAA